VWQIISIPFKFCVILPIKILAVPVKLSINIIKLFTEFLPMVILPFLRMILWQLVVLMSFIVVLLADSICNLVEISDDILISVVCVIILIPMIILLSLIFIVLTIPIAGLIIALRIIQLVGRAITSPEKNAKIAFAHGRELGGEIGGLKIGNVIGALGALISILITAVAWANVLPLAYGAIISHYPIVLQLLTWVFQLPIVVSFLGAIQSALTTVSVAIIPALSPVVIALSTYLGIKVSAIALMYGLLVAPVVVILSRIGDELSNWWASSHKGGPFTSIGNIVIDLLQKCTATDATARLQSQSKSVEPSQKARHLCLDKNDAFDSTLRRFRMVDSATAVTMPVLFGDFESTTDLAEPPMLQQWYYSAIPK
jgi:hypothetical protein